MPKNRLLVIVVLYNGMEWLERCLASVEDSTVSSDIYIVDNGSTDGSLDFVKANYPNAILIESRENLMFGKANNLGFKYALSHGYDYVYLLNQDAWVEPNTFEELIEKSQQYPEFGVLSPLQMSAGKKTLDFDFKCFCSPEMLSDYVCDSIKDVYEVEEVMAAHWLLPINTIRKVGAFSPTFPHYGEDTNYIFRIKYHGMKVGVVTSAIGIHDRENRPCSKEKMGYLKYIYLISEMSRPANDGYSRNVFIKNIVKLVLGKSGIPKKYWKLIFKNRKEIEHNRVLSQREGAFL